MSGQPWYKRYPHDFIFGVRGLGPELIGGYTVCLDLMYANGGPIADDMRWLGGILGCSTRAARSIVDRLIEAGKLDLINGQLSNKRAISELENGAKTSRNLSEWGANGGRTRVENERRARQNNDLGQAGLKQLEQNRIDKESTRARQPETKPKLDATGRLNQPGDHTGDLPADKFGDAAREVMRLAGMHRPPRDAGLVKLWMEAGADPERDIFPTVERLTTKALDKGDPPSSFRFFDKAVRDQVQRYNAEIDADIARWRAQQAREERELAEQRAEEEADRKLRAEIAAEREALRRQNLATEPHQGAA